jgi:hypothetical protein
MVVLLLSFSSSFLLSFRLHLLSSSLFRSGKNAEWQSCLDASVNCLFPSLKMSVVQGKIAIQRKKGRVTISGHLGKEMPIGTMLSVFKQAHIEKE